VRFAAMLVTVIGLACLIGCGRDGGEESSADSRSPLLDRMADWRNSAISYDTILQGCRQPYPTRGYVAACTGKWRRKYGSRTERLLRALRAAEGSASPACRQALAKLSAGVASVTKALKQAFVAYSRALDTPADRTNRGPPVAVLLARADSVTKRETKVANGLSTTVARTCPS
jgi:hypothetical protein